MYWFLFNKFHSLDDTTSIEQAQFDKKLFEQDQLGKQINCFDSAINLILIQLNLMVNKYSKLKTVQNRIYDCLDTLLSSISTNRRSQLTDCL